MRKKTRADWYSAYSRYIVFFHQEIDRLGPMGAIEEYVFSPQAVGPPLTFILRVNWHLYFHAHSRSC